MKLGGRMFLVVLSVSGAAVGAVAVGACASFGGTAEGTRLAKMKASTHFSAGKFHNALPTRNAMEEGGLWSMFGEMWHGDQVRVPAEQPPIQTRRGADFANPPPTGLRITWLGHSTTLIEVDGYRLLTDPVWSERASPVSFAGPKRFAPTPLALEELPALDAILISHDHFDHLDETTIRRLARLGVPFFVGLGVGAHLERWGVPQEAITELEWWQSVRLGNLTIHSTPARHFSGRSPFSRDKTLWTSWAIVGPAHRVYFSGDTGMFPGFAEIGDRLGPFDVTMLEVGAYNAYWADVHLGPEQAAAAHRLLRGKLMLPIHWGTFNLAFHGWTEPAERLLVAAPTEAFIWQPGQSVEPAAPPQLVRWWPAVPWQTAAQAPVVSSGLSASLADAAMPSGAPAGAVMAR